MGQSGTAQPPRSRLVLGAARGLEWYFARRSRSGVEARSAWGNSRRNLDCCLDLGGLRKTLAEYSQLCDLLGAQLVVALRELRHRAVEPVLLIIRSRSDDSALHHVLKHLIARLFERCCDGRCASRVSRLLFAH